MKPVTIIQGNCLDELRKLPADSVHCVVTSPPYWGLRDYGIPPSIWGEPGSRHRGGPHGKTGELITRDCTARNETGDVPTGSFCRRCGAWLGCHGLEPTPELFIQHEVLIFREVRRVLREDGTCWINLGDSMSSDAGKRKSADARGPKQCTNAGSTDTGSRAVPGLPGKNLLMIPQRVAIALQADGWWLRSQIPWLKRNSMPESVTDRPATATEYLFLLTKSADYFYDAEAIKQQVSTNTHARLSQDVAAQVGSERAHAGGKTNGRMKAVGGKVAEVGQGVKANSSFEGACSLLVSSRNRRNSDWWFESWQGLYEEEPGEPLAFVVNPRGFKGAHFATYPAALVRPCILAGTSAHGCCPECGEPWRRVIEKTPATSKHCPKTDGIYQAQGGNGHKTKGTVGMSGGGRIEGTVLTTGWEPGCRCARADVVPATVLDPFGGSGTTARVARHLGRRAIIIEINPEYVKIAENRIGLACHFHDDKPDEPQMNLL